MMNDVFSGSDDWTSWQDGMLLTEWSPSGKYRLEALCSDKADQVWFALYGLNETTPFCGFHVEDSRGIHAFVQVGEDEYFLAATEQCGGQSVVDLTRRKWANAIDEGGFIGWEYFLSPDGKYLAVSGCFWACPWQIMVFDFSQPLSVPWPVVAEMISSGNVDPVGWEDSTHFRVVHRVWTAPDDAISRVIDLSQHQGIIHLAQLP